MNVSEQEYQEKFKKALESADAFAQRGHINRAMVILEDILSQKPLRLRTVGAPLPTKSDPLPAEKKKVS